MVVQQDSHAVHQAARDWGQWGSLEWWANTSLLVLVKAGEDALGPGLVEEEGLGGADPPQQPQVPPRPYKGSGLGPGSIVYLGSNRTY